MLSSTPRGMTGNLLKTSPHSLFRHPIYKYIRYVRVSVISLLPDTIAGGYFAMQSYKVF